MKGDFNNIKVILLAGGYGTRLKPLTNNLPKCLMPILGRPLLEHWLMNLKAVGLSNVLVNTHYMADMVETFLRREIFKGWVTSRFEEKLLGTAGTVRFNKNFILNNVLLLIHADNWTHCNLPEFIEYHFKHRNKNCLITMMTYDSDNPQYCGIVEVDKEGILLNFHEKKINPPGNKANAAIYLIEPEVLNWLEDNPNINDFSTEVVPFFIGKIATWHSNKTHVDIGTLNSLLKAQNDKISVKHFFNDEWIENYKKLNLVINLNINNEK